MPTTIVSIMALAFIVGPGYLARWVRSGTRPRPAESGTQELTRVTVFGFFSTISALFLLYVVRGHLFPAQWIADPEPLLSDSAYLSRNVGLVARTGAYVLLIACLLAVSATYLVLRGIHRRGTRVRTTDDALASAWWVALEPSVRDRALYQRTSDGALYATAHLKGSSDIVAGYVVLLSKDLQSEGELVLADQLDTPRRITVLRLSEVSHVEIGIAGPSATVTAPPPSTVAAP